MSSAESEGGDQGDARVTLRLQGRVIEARVGASLLQGWLEAGHPLVENVGCMGQGVCGACCVLLRREGSDDVRTALACETVCEEGMEAAFIDHFPARRPHAYELHTLGDSWTAFNRVPEIFPEAPDCRHCGGCDRACPKGIEVERMVNLASAGRAFEAAALFDDCVMCNLCVTACPERIDPAHLGQLVRRMVASLTLRPGDLMARLREIDAGQQRVDVSAEIVDEEGT